MMNPDANRKMRKADQFRWNEERGRLEKYQIDVPVELTAEEIEGLEIQRKRRQERYEDRAGADIPRIPTASESSPFKGGDSENVAAKKKKKMKKGKGYGKSDVQDK